MNKTCTYFEKIMSIPRPSGNEKKIAAFLCNFAKENNFEYYTDDYFNVIIKKNNHSENTIILQCHTDMVCVNDIGVNKDFDNEGIDWYIDGDYYKAKGTTLGADNGIGIAMILSLLKENNNNFPNIEAIFTTQEETTMLGATNLHYSKLNGNTLISLDGIKEGDLEVSSAGMCNIELKKPLKEVPIPAYANAYEIEIDYLLGGHSGDDIYKNRINAIHLLAQILNDLEVIGIVDIKAGQKNNVIPSSANCKFLTLSDKEQVNNICKKYRELTEENDNHPQIYAKSFVNFAEAYDATEIINLITNFNHGMITSTDDGFPILSENMGVIEKNMQELKILLSVRSSSIEQEESQLKEIEKLAKQNNFNYILELKKPFFPYRENSKLRETLTKTYKELFNKEVSIKRVHACMEGGIFSKNIKDLDICTISPNVYDIHTTQERISISSINRVYEWLLKTLVELNENV